MHGPVYTAKVDTCMHACLYIFLCDIVATYLV